MKSQEMHLSSCSLLHCVSKIEISTILATKKRREEKHSCLFHATLYYLRFCIPKIWQIFKCFTRKIFWRLLVKYFKICCIFGIQKHKLYKVARNKQNCFSPKIKYTSKKNTTQCSIFPFLKHCTASAFLRKNCSCTLGKTLFKKYQKICFWFFNNCFLIMYL